MVDMAHDRDDRRHAAADGRPHRYRCCLQQADLDIGFGHADAPCGRTRCHDQFGGVGVDHGSLIVAMTPIFMSALDDVHAALGHAVGEFLDRDRSRARTTSRTTLAAVALLRT